MFDCSRCGSDVGVIGGDGDVVGVGGVVGVGVALGVDAAFRARLLSFVSLLLL